VTSQTLESAESCCSKTCKMRAIQRENICTITKVLEEERPKTNSTKCLKAEKPRSLEQFADKVIA